MSEWPRLFHRVVADKPDVGSVVELFQHTPANTAALAEWCGGDTAFVNGGPVVLVGGTRHCVDRLCGLGDFAARDGDRWWAESADGIYQRFVAAIQED